MRKATEEGARIVTGSNVTGQGKGHHFEPTLMVGATAAMEIMCRETFGPVLPIQAVKNLDEAIALANDTEYGLTSSIYTNNINSALRACRELKFGEIYINRENFEAMQGFHAGRKNSGIGGSDGKHGLYEFTETHVIYIQGQ
ncbi:hypothetical protein ASD31_20235 [Rhizobium sp. Root482]|nr:hypothetical protein ASD31_20235 [Rhizobium sp. Root482]